MTEMLLAVNIGNSSLRFGVFKGSECVARWLIKTKPHKSADEYVVVVHSLFKEHGVKVESIDSVIAASVVPVLTGVLRESFTVMFGRAPIFINYKMNSGLTFPVEKPTELGGDLLANGAAAYHLYRRDTIVIDFGTALSFTVVRENGLLAGIVIAPGVISALGSLVKDTAQLPSIELTAPERVVGVETIGCIQSGIIHGYTGLIENIAAKIDEEQGSKSLVIATGGTAHIYEKICRRIDIYDDLHTLKGLQVMHALNFPAK